MSLEFSPAPPRRARSRGMGEILSLSETIKDDAKFVARVREIVARVRKEETAWHESQATSSDGLEVL